MEAGTIAVVKIVVSPGDFLCLNGAVVDSLPKVHVQAYGWQNTEVPKLHAQYEGSSSIGTWRMNQIRGMSQNHFKIKVQFSRETDT